MPRKPPPPPPPPPSPVVTPTHLASTEAEDIGVKELRIHHIMDRMRRFAWRTGRTGKELAIEWGVTRQYVRRLAAIAKRRIVAEVTDPDRVRMTVGVALERVVEAGLRRTKTQAPNLHAVTSACKVWADIMGASAPTRSELTGKDGGPLQVRGPVIMIPPESDD
jgi:hypothetical protein